MYKTVVSGGLVNRGSHIQAWADGIPIQDYVEDLFLSRSGIRVTDYQTQGWRKRLHDGDNATTLLSAAETTVETTPAVMYRKVSGPAGGVFESMLSENLFRLGMPDSPDPSFSTLATNQAITMFLSKLQSTRAEFQGGIFLGELAEALHMIKNPILSFRQSLDDYIRIAKGYRGRHGSLTGRNRSVSRLWLEYVYGWGPLLKDAKDAAEAAAALISYSSPWRYVTHDPGVNIESLPSVPSMTFAWYLFNPSPFIVETYHKATTQFRGVIDLSMDPTGNGRRAIPTLGLTLRDFVPTVWELIPFSFVVDYFTNAGDILEALSYGVSGVRWYSKTTRLESVRTAGGFNATPYLPSSEFISERLDPGSMKLTSKTVLRQTQNGLLLPDFQVRIPGFGSRKWLNLAALARALT